MPIFINEVIAEVIPADSQQKSEPWPQEKIPLSQMESELVKT